jgi:cytochrome c-type biogenesis protein CcmH
VDKRPRTPSFRRKPKSVKAFFLALLLSLLAAQLSSAKEAAPAADDPALEHRVTEIASELRCLVCQNQTIADSHAPLAVDLRDEIRTQLKAGRTAQEINAYMVARYGDFVLYRPPLKATTLLLWAGPFVLFVIGLVVMFRKIRQRRADSAPLSAEDHEAAARLLSAGDER